MLGLEPVSHVVEEMSRTRAPSLLRACLLCLLLSTGASLVPAQRYEDFTTRTPLKEGDVLVVGFMGGRESWDNQQRGVRKLALRLRSLNLPGVHVETVENNKRRVAVELIRNAFDRDRDGQLDERERASVRMIVYGQSFGGAAVVKLAQQLKKMGVPVLLTLQVDSIGRGDKVIPSNVARAANLFQRDGLIIKGERKIRPEDPSRTTIIGNFKFDYSGKKIDLAEVSWLKRLFRTAHTKMDHDPEVWALVERTILDVIAAR
jgi:pimeloyl-ACP methyl ester carboxylesterase